jgi:heme oxygenase
MLSRQTARFVLCDATAQWHQRVDDVFAAVDLTDRLAYVRFLCAQAAAHLPAEQALEAHGIAAVIPDWPSRRRAHLIRNDLLALDLDVPPLEPEPIFSGVAALLGATYVLEGSRLGGAMLLRSVPAQFPTAFLSAGTSMAWRDLISLLDQRLCTRIDIDEAIQAACQTFALFERSGKRLLPSE